MSGDWSKQKPNSKRNCKQLLLKNLHQQKWQIWQRPDRISEKETTRKTHHQEGEVFQQSLQRWESKINSQSLVRGQMARCVIYWIDGQSWTGYPWWPGGQYKHGWVETQVCESSFIVTTHIHTKTQIRGYRTASTCDIRPWTCSTVIFALSRVIFASCDSSCVMKLRSNSKNYERERERERWGGDSTDGYATTKWRIKYLQMPFFGQHCTS